MDEPALQSGCPTASRHVGRTAETAPRREDHHDLCHSRPDRGDDARRPSGGPGSGSPSADRHTAQLLRDAPANRFVAGFIGSLPMNCWTRASKTGKFGQGRSVSVCLRESRRGVEHPPARPSRSASGRNMCGCMRPTQRMGTAASSARCADRTLGKPTVGECGTWRLQSGNDPRRSRRCDCSASTRRSRYGLTRPDGAPPLRCGNRRAPRL